MLHFKRLSLSCREINVGVHKLGLGYSTFGFSDQDPVWISVGFCGRVLARSIKFCFIGALSAAVQAIVIEFSCEIPFRVDGRMKIWITMGFSDRDHV